MNKFRKLMLSLVAALAFVVSGYAQFTTSTMSGRITDASGEPLTGAAVVAVHTPSGTQYYAVANTDGYYTIQGMRPGGPYEVTVSFVGCTSVQYNDVTLALGETYSQNAELKASETLDEAIVVVSTSKFAAEKTGASTNVSNKEMMNLPNSDRSIKALTKLSPYASGMSFAGSDGRSTNFTVDGANLNNNFGLSSNLPGGGTPISLDAIEEVQLVVAPYDVRQSNFVGGGINAVTKSGTNTFKATAYTYSHNEKLRGNKLMGEDLGERDPESNKIYGVTVGGPIIKNKLFFFVNFETQKNPGQAIQYQADAAKQQVLQQIADKLKNDYGYNPGSYTDYPGGIENMKLLARIDWNISDNHKLSLRYNNTTNTTWYSPNGNSCDDNFRNKGYNRASKESQPFSYNMYSQQNDVMSFAGELNSRFGNNVSNRLIVTYTDINDQRGSNSDVFPHIDIMNGDLSEGNYVPYTSLGYELFTYNNGVKNNVITASDNVTLYAGAHTVTAGVTYERQTAANSYMRNATGYYRFASPEDFLNGNLPVSFALCYGYNGEANPRGEITYNQLGFYAQDEWNVTKNFKLTYGLRADTIIFDDSQLLTNNAIKAKDFGGRHIDTGEWPATTVQVSPRIGFNWDVNGDKSLVVRGGTGFFQGRLPLVFFTNMPQNAGMIQRLVSKGDYSGKISGGKLTMSDATIANLTKLNGGKTTGGQLITYKNEMIKALGFNTTITPEEGAIGASDDINAVANDFKMPQIWKTSLAIDWTVPTSFPFTVTAEGMFNKTLYGVMLKNWNINEAKASANKFAGPDNRYNYGSDFTYTGNNAYVLTNSTEGWGYTANVTINMEPVKNLNIMAAYTHTESKEISGMPGSAASSAYQGLYSVNGPNFATLQRSQYVVPDKVVASISYFLPFNVFGGNGLHLNAYYSAYSSEANSFCYSNDMNGDGLAYDLMYIPASQDEIAFKNDGDAQAFWAFVQQDKYLSKHLGEYAEANAARSPWVHRVDLRIAEDFSFKIGNTKHNFQLSASIDNIGNMINSDWGVQKLAYNQSGFTNNITPLKYEGVNAQGVPTFSFNKVNGAYPTETYTNFYKNTAECWQVLFGIKYFFN